MAGQTCYSFQWKGKDIRFCVDDEMAKFVSPIVTWFNGMNHRDATMVHDAEKWLDKL